MNTEIHSTNPDDKIIFKPTDTKRKVAGYRGEYKYERKDTFPWPVYYKPKEGKGAGKWLEVMQVVKHKNGEDFLLKWKAYDYYHEKVIDRYINLTKKDMDTAYCSGNNDGVLSNLMYYVKEDWDEEEGIFGCA